MEDLDALARAMRVIEDKTEDDPPQTVVDYIEYCLKNANTQARCDVLDLFRMIIDHADESERSSLLNGAALRLFPLLFASISLRPSARYLILLIVDYTLPRELFLSYAEVLYYIHDAASSRSSLSDDEDEDSQDQEEDVVKQLQVVLEAYTKTFSMMKSGKSTLWLLEPIEKIESILPLIVDDLEIQAARDLYSAVAAFISAGWEWAVISSDSGGEQKSMLTRLGYTATAILTPRIEAQFAERWFFASFPRYKKSLETNWEPAQASLEVVKTVLFEMGITPTHLVGALCNPSNIFPHSSLAALTLLTASLPEISPDFNPTYTHPIEDCMDILTAALSSSAIDAGLAYLWSLVHARGRIKLEHATLLLELLMPLAAKPPNPTLRLLVFTLIARMIDGVPSGSNQVSLYKQLLERANPYDAIRVQSLTLLRDTITRSNSSVFVPSLFDLLHDELFTIPNVPTGNDLVPTITPLEMNAAQFAQSMYAAWLTDAANLLRLWVQRDEENETGIRRVAELRKIREDFLDPQIVRVQQLKEQGVEDVQVDFVLERWADALERANSVVERVLQSPAE